MTKVEVTYGGPKGNTGSNGTNGASAYVCIAYASDASGTNFTTTFSALLSYIAIKSATVAMPSPQASDFAGLWFCYKGDQGDPGGSAGHWALQEVPTGARNGSNQSFTLEHTPTGTVVPVYNGRDMQDTVDSSYSGTALTLITFAPDDAKGDRFWVRYPYA